MQFNILEGPAAERENARCAHCNKVMNGGRSDRKFCNDICRNTHNREKRREEASLAGEDVAEAIIRIIRKNYALLQKFNRADEQYKIVDRLAIYQKGFNFMYFTSTKVISGDRYYFCFDHGWHDLDYGLIELIIDPDQVRY
jgi:hypothetical protein